MAGIFFVFGGLVWGALYAPLAHTIDAGGLFADDRDVQTARLYHRKYALWARLWATTGRTYGSPFFARHTPTIIG